jgi:hypothetical protein
MACTTLQVRMSPAAGRLGGGNTGAKGGKVALLLKDDSGVIEGGVGGVNEMGAVGLTGVTGVGAITEGVAVIGWVMATTGRGMAVGGVAGWGVSTARSVGCGVTAKLGGGVSTAQSVGCGVTAKLGGGVVGGVSTARSVGCGVTAKLGGGVVGTDIGESGDGNEAAWGRMCGSMVTTSHGGVVCEDDVSTDMGESAVGDEVS